MSTAITSSTSTAARDSDWARATATVMRPASAAAIRRVSRTMKRSGSPPAREALIASRRDQGNAGVLSAIERLGSDDFDAEAGKADISPLARGEEADRGNAEVAQNLRAQSDFAPLPLARGGGGG